MPEAELKNIFTNGFYGFYCAGVLTGGGAVLPPPPRLLDPELRKSGVKTHFE